MSSVNGCKRYEWLVSALADGEGAAQAHLMDCADCRAAWADSAAMLAEIAAGLPLGRAPDLRAVVALRIAAAPPARVRRASWLYQAAAYAAAAALVIGAASLPLSWRGVRPARSSVASAVTFAVASAVIATRHSAPASQAGAAAAYDFEDALIAGAADTGEDNANLESRLFSGAADGLPDLN